MQTRSTHTRKMVQAQAAGRVHGASNLAAILGMKNGKPAWQVEQEKRHELFNRRWTGLDDATLERRFKLFKAHPDELMAVPLNFLTDDEKKLRESLGEQRTNATRTLTHSFGADHDAAMNLRLDPERTKPHTK